MAKDTNSIRAFQGLNIIEIESGMKPGYIYVLVHPSDSNLYKIGQTTRHPEQRLLEHNSDFAKHAGRVVKETGQKWELKTYISVPDTNYAEATFWAAPGLTDFPYLLGGVEVQKMEWKLVQAGLEAATKAGVPPSPKVPDHVFANTAWMKKRLEGRGITLIGQVKSKVSGRNNFQCSDGHVWRTKPLYVAEGEGCPQCGIGERTPDQMAQAAPSGVLCLLINPDKPGTVKMGLTYKAREQFLVDDDWPGWTVHRYRSVEEPALAEKLIWELLGHTPPDDREIRIDLEIAERAFRKIHYRLDEEIASAERAKELG